ncbi:hypothetical protein A9Q84_14350 [Halobacteriovorax marinus]|uniref:FMN dependent NADH:quinone oxidoreductase n=1 Tax=Halobacteriovorax marinus TaxID=97084 RepID=A0A1Y5F5A6_9BACT|nr:hypothetical protein A9Q84_14350 [Halobacteriovorax marinus]
MKNILYIKSSPRGDESFSTKLADELFKKLLSKHGKLNITKLDFAENPPSHLSGQHLGAMFTPIEHQSLEQKLCMEESNSYVEQLKNNDIIIISYPVWNFLVPSCLKAWIDQIVRAGVTFQYNGHTPEGLITDKLVYLVLARGGMYPDYFDNKVESLYDFSIDYMKTVLNYIGMKDVTVIKAEGLAIPDIKDQAMEKAIESIQL